MNSNIEVCTFLDIHQRFSVLKSQGLNVFTISWVCIRELIGSHVRIFFLTQIFTYWGHSSCAMSTAIAMCHEKNIESFHAHNWADAASVVRVTKKQSFEMWLNREQRLKRENKRQISSQIEVSWETWPMTLPWLSGLLSLTSWPYGAQRNQLSHLVWPQGNMANSHKVSRMKTIA